jgi:hypothetical protein
MLTLYSYPELFGVADNNGYGLKVFAFLKLAGVPFRQELPAWAAIRRRVKQSTSRPARRLLSAPAKT